jgi:hypothetical protein
MYGYAVPMLFPLAIVQLGVIYVLEILLLYYYYKRPPMYDADMSNQCMTLLFYAPLFYFSFGYWYASNNQLLSNEFLYPREMVESTKVT